MHGSGGGPRICEININSRRPVMRVVLALKEIVLVLVMETILDSAAEGR
jgi:hypothetical protein